MDVLMLSDASPSMWERFQEGRALDETPLVDRWTRVRALGVPALGASELPIVSETTLRERKELHHDLLRASAVVLDDAASVMSEKSYTLLLCDPSGLVLGRWGGGEFEPIAQRARLIEGADWSEPARGTNAIGTAIAEGRAVAVEGCAHYARDNHSLACYASVLRGPDGQVVGLVDATSFSRAASRFVSVAVAGIARAIEERLQLLARERQGFDTLSALVERLGEPAVLLDEAGRARFTNHAARSALFGGRVGERLVRGADGAWRDPRHPSVRSTRDEVLGPGARLVFFAATTAAATRTRRDPEPFDTLLGHDPALLETKSRAARFARSSLPVLLLAETGTGKELLARALHQASSCAAGPFVAVNCGALSGQLLESELFGYGPGAFTGARAAGQAGKIEAASGGTLFLDEVAEMSPALQAMLLRVLEDGTYSRVGEVTARRAELRLVCATCRDLEAMVAEGRFRSDLYFRIRGATLTLPPLRARTDVLALAEALLGRLAREAGRAVPRLSDGARVFVVEHGWPGNVRELKSALMHAVVLADDTIEVEHFPGRRVSPAPRPSSSPASTREDADKGALLAALASAGGNLTAAARQLGVARSTLYRMMDRHGVPR